MPASTPIGVLIKVQLPTINKLPVMAFNKPPPAVPGAGVLEVNIAKLTDENPLINKTLSIHNKKNIPILIATMHKASARLFVLFLPASIAFLLLKISLMF